MEKRAKAAIGTSLQWMDKEAESIKEENRHDVAEKEVEYDENSDSEGWRLVHQYVEQMKYLGVAVKKGKSMFLLTPR